MGDLRLLVVDDDALVTWALEKAASQRHAGVVVASTGAEALESLRDRSYDLAFVDVHLPDANGLDLLLEIRRLSPETRLVVLTSDASASNREYAQERGAWQFIEKPFDLAEIVQVLDECTGPDVEGRRRFERHVCRLSLHLDSGDAGCFEATAIDFSHQGVRLRTPCCLRPGQVVGIHPTGDNPFCPPPLLTHRSATVVWVTTSESGITAGLALHEPA